MNQPVMGELEAVSQFVDFISLRRITLMDDIVVSGGSSRGGRCHFFSCFCASAV